MAGTPKFKIYSPRGEYVACVKHPSDGAAIVALYGDGATIRLGHRKANILWEEGVTGDAGDSLDEVAEAVYRTMAQWRDEASKRAGL